MYWVSPKELWEGGGGFDRLNWYISSSPPASEFLGQSSKRGEGGGGRYQ
jgi:hypothetical protein